MSRQLSSVQPSSRQNQLRFCRRTTNAEKLSILLVGTYEFCNLMQECVYNVCKDVIRTEATVSITESIESILQSTKDLHIDFIVFLMNTAQRQSLEQVERDICLLDPIYLCDKTILVDGCNNLSPAHLGVSYDELFTFAQKYHIHIIHGNIRDENSRINLAQRITAFTVVVCGLKNGTPAILHFPTDQFPVY